MTVSLSAELQRFVEQKIRAGDYTSADEAVNSLLSFLAQEEDLGHSDMEKLRAEIAVGIAEADRGELSNWDPDEIWAEVERRHAERQANGAG